MKRGGFGHPFYFWGYLWPVRYWAKPLIEVVSVSNPAIFLDRDGVINEDTGYVSQVDDFHFLPGVIDALQLASKYPIATPVNWVPGKDVMIQPTVSDADAEAKFPGFKRTEVPSGKGYIRFTNVQ